MPNYNLNLDGEQFRRQRELLLNLSDSVRRGQSYAPQPGDEGLLEGLIGLTDELADQAHDMHAIDCLLADPE